MPDAKTGRYRQGPTTCLHRPDRACREGTLRRVPRGLGNRYPAIVRLWDNAWAEFVPFLAFDAEIRTVVCSTNAIESVIARIRRAVRARGHFPTRPPPSSASTSR